MLLWVVLLTQLMVEKYLKMVRPTLMVTHGELLLGLSTLQLTQNQPLGMVLTPNN